MPQGKLMMLFIVFWHIAMFLNIVKHKYENPQQIHSGWFYLVLHIVVFLPSLILNFQFWFFGHF